MINQSKDELSTLTRFAAALDNATNNAQIATLLDQVNYNKEKIDMGKGLVATATAAYQLNQRKERERSSAYVDFTDKKKALNDKYKIHRKRAKILFSENEQLSIELGLNQNIPKVHLAWLQSVEMFYNALLANKAVKTQMATLKVSEQDLTTTQTLIGQVKSTYTTYLNLKGEGQEATRAKNQALRIAKKWMKTFYKVAEVGLESMPQLLEALGKLVRS